MNLTKILINSVASMVELAGIYFFMKYFIGERTVEKKRLRIFLAGFYCLSMLAVSVSPGFLFTALTQITMLIVFSGLFTTSIWKRLGYSVLIYIFSLLNEGLSMVMSMNLFNAQTNDMMTNNLYYGFMAINSKMFLLVLIFMVQFFLKKVKYNKGGFTYTGLLMTPLASIFAIYYIVENSSGNHYLFAIAVAFFLVISNLVVFYIFDNQAKIERKQLRLEYIEEQYQNQITHYNELYAARTEMHKMWHDLNNTMITLSSYANSGDTEGILKYLNEQNKLVQNIRKTVDTNNPHVDSVINAKQRRMDGYDISYAIPDLNMVDIEPMDIAMLLATALDNAIEACDKLSQDLKKKIRIRMTIQGQYLSICVENTALDDLKIEDERLKTTKEDSARHGFGMETIKRIASKYEGDVSFRYINGEFLLAILLKSRS